MSPNKVLRVEDFDEPFILELMVTDHHFYEKMIGYQYPQLETYFLPFKFREKREEDHGLLYKGVEYVRLDFDRVNEVFSIGTNCYTAGFKKNNEVRSCYAAIKGQRRRFVFKKCFSGTANYYE